MPAKLPINLQDLLRQRTVEGERIEYKAGWNPDATLRTLCAFANDFANLGGGYVVVGQACDENGQPVFPPAGLAANQLDKIQRELLAHCQLIQPPYFPVLSVEEVDGRQLIVLWAPGGQNRPYKELELTEGRSTGVPKILKAMAANGSPPPMFETDEDRAAYVIRLPVHPLAQAPEAATPQVTPPSANDIQRAGSPLVEGAEGRDVAAGVAGGPSAQRHQTFPRGFPATRPGRGAGGDDTAPGTTQQPATLPRHWAGRTTAGTPVRLRTRKTAP
jgi:ATP-dependent DNA helicase RecG